MPALTLKNIPEPLYQSLKEAASTHHRSMNSELIYRLEQMFSPRRVALDERLQRARELRRGINDSLIEIDDIQDAIHQGRA